MAQVTSDQIFTTLRRRIFDGDLGGGMPLDQEKLANEFGVDGLPVNDALRRLEGEGLVRQDPQNGPVVLVHSIDDVIEMLDIRIGLETRALKLAIPNLRHAHIAEAEAILATYDETNSPSSWAYLNLKFHLALYRPANRPRLLKMIEDLALGTQRYTRIHISNVLGRDRPQNDHYGILHAARIGDVDNAVRLLEEHITQTQQALLAPRKSAGAPPAN